MITRFLQISDLHFGLNMKLINRNEYCREALNKATEIVRINKLDALVIAGDLFENDKLSRDDIVFLVEIFESIDPVPVIISPGNHDFLSIDSPYNQTLLNLLKIKGWPQNVKIFKKPEFSCFSLGSVNFYGKPCIVRESKAFDDCNIVLDPSKINIAVIHASRVKYKPENKDIWFPFDDSEILNCPFDYIALGHYHEYSEIKTAENIKAAYSGSMLPASIGEDSQKGGIIVNVEKKEEKINTKLEFVNLSNLTVKKIEILSNLDREKMQKLLLEEIQKTENPNHTLFVVKLYGIGEINLNLIRDILSEYKVIFDLSEFTNINLDKLKETKTDTTVGMFIQEMLKLIENSHGRQKQILQNALVYGLDAFAQRPIIPKHYDED